MNIRDLSGLAIALTAVVFLPHVYADDTGEILVSHAWVQAMPPSQTTTAAYMTIMNNSTREAVLVSASSEIAGVTEIHQMSNANGMMNMAMVPNVHIPARGKVLLQPGGYHIMLINLKKPADKGTMVPITLHFQDGSAVVVNAQVKMQDPASSSSMPGMNM